MILGFITFMSYLQRDHYFYMNRIYGFGLLHLFIVVISTNYVQAGIVEIPRFFVPGQFLENIWLLVKCTVCSNADRWLDDSEFIACFIEVKIRISI